MKAIFSFIVCVMALAFQAGPAATSVTIEVTNLRSNTGTVLVALYDKADKFPHDAANNAVGRKKAPIVNKTASVTFTNLPPGKYAVALLHDENNNMRMDFNLVHMPKEGYGFSNNAKGRMGPPDFNKAAFDLGNAPKTVAIKMKYGL